MLVLLAADGTRLDAGAVALALARRWSDAGQQVLFVDADTSGSRLARRPARSSTPTTRARCEACHR